MISYDPLWQTMKRKKATTYTLRKNEPKRIGSGTLSRLQVGLSVSTKTIDAICSILNCDIYEVIEFIPAQKREKIYKNN